MFSLMSYLRVLPPLRGIEHQIDLIPGAPLPNKAPYRVNLEETKEIQRKVQQLIDNGQVRESLSPCAVPVILVPHSTFFTVLHYIFKISIMHILIFDGLQTKYFEVKL